MDLVTLVQNQLSGEAISKLSALIGESENKTRSAVEAAVPTLLSSMANMAQTTGGAQKVASLFGNFDPAAFGNFGSMLSGQADTVLNKGSNLLGNLFGGGMLDTVIGGLSQFTGLGKSMVQKLIGFLTPLIMSTVAGQIKGGLSPSNLSQFFAGQKDSIANAVPAALASVTMPSLSDLGHAGRQTMRAATEASSSMLPWLVPLLVLAAIGFGVYWWVNQNNPPAAPPVLSVNPANKGADNALGTVTQLKSDLTSSYRALSETLGTVNDAASADAALPKLKDVSSKLDGLKAIWDKLPQAQQTMIQSVTQGQLPDFKAMINKILAMPGVGDKLKTTLADITTKLNALGGNPAGIQ